MNEEPRGLQGFFIGGIWEMRLLLWADIGCVGGLSGSMRFGHGLCRRTGR